MNYESYYTSLALPSWAPPSNLFGIVWPILYVLIAISFSYVFYQVIAKKRWPRVLLVPFIVNLIANALYTPLFFNLQLPLLAAVDILIVLGSIVWIMSVMFRRARWVSVMQVPYLLWVSFATCLQFAILMMN